MSEMPGSQHILAAKAKYEHRAKGLHPIHGSMTDIFPPREQRCYKNNVYKGTNNRANEHCSVLTGVGHFQKSLRCLVQPRRGSVRHPGCLRPVIKKASYEESKAEDSE